MAKNCPSCGYREADNQAQYCNKCGYPFPQILPGRMPGTPAQPRRPGPAPVKRSLHRNAGTGGFLSFGTLIAEKHLKLIYILGAVMIVLVSIMGIAGMFAKKTTGEDGETNASLLSTAAIAEYPAGSPLFWIGFLVAGSILWRMFCELFALLSRTPGGRGPEEVHGEYSAPEYEEEIEAPGPRGSGKMVECPKCHKIVPLEDLRECEHCGVQGCSNCIRMMGLLKKTLTCRECYEAK